MRTAVRWIVAAITIVHGLIHLLGVVKGFGWADVDTLTEPVSHRAAWLWLVASVLLIATGLLLITQVRWWWIIGAAALIVSQATILTAWDDAKAGTAANVIVLVAVLYGFFSQGPFGLRAQYRRQVNKADAAVPAVTGINVVTEGDLSHLPAPVATYVRRGGAVGQPKVRSFRATIHGRIRAGADKPRMSFVGEQVNTYGPSTTRLFLLDATMFGMPVDVFHAFVGPEARMRVKACSIVTMVDAAGPAMHRGETVTIFNDLCILAPGALVDAPIMWEPIDETRVRGTFTRDDEAVTAELVFDADGDLVDFVSDDRSRSNTDGEGFTDQRWSTPVRDYQDFDGHRVASVGEARWHAPEPEGEFAYLDFHLDDIVYGLTRL